MGATAITPAFAASLAQAADDKTAASAASGASASGAEKMFTGLDKNKEHAAAPEHAGDKASTGATGAPASPKKH